MNNGIWMIGVLSIMLVSGCALTPGVSTGGKTPAGPSPLIAKYSERAVVVDGKLDDPVWGNAPVYKLSLSKAEEDKGNILHEAGYVQLAWDEDYLYAGIKFYDSDIVQESEENQQHHYRSGDLVEVFLKPERNTWYWEIYGTPNEKKTVFWFPGRGRLGLESHYQAGMNLDNLLIGT
ncbi:MAG: sugar-binding protein, partial [Myxococcota bacterium]